MSYSLLDMIVLLMKVIQMEIENFYLIQWQITDADMVLLARDISKQIEAELEYPGQIKVNVIRESRVIDYAK